MQFAPEVKYTPPGGVLTTITYDIPLDLPDQRINTVGGARTSVAGVRVGYRKRYDHIAVVTMRVSEALYTATLAWLLDAQFGRPFSFQFDQSDAATLYTPCYLVKPAMGEQFDTPRSREWEAAYDFTIEIARAPNLLFDLRLGLGG